MKILDAGSRLLSGPGDQHRGECFQQGHDRAVGLKKLRRVGGRQQRQIRFPDQRRTLAVGDSNHPGVPRTGQPGSLQNLVAVRLKGHGHQYVMRADTGQIITGQTAVAGQDKQVIESHPRHVPEGKGQGIGRSDAEDEDPPGGQDPVRRLFQIRHRLALEHLFEILQLGSGHLAHDGATTPLPGQGLQPLGAVLETTQAGAQKIPEAFAQILIAGITQVAGQAYQGIGLDPGRGCHGAHGLHPGFVGVVEKVAGRFAQLWSQLRKFFAEPFEDAIGRFDGASLGGHVLPLANTMIHLYHFFPTTATMQLYRSAAGNVVMRTQAKTVIIGGGVMGCSLAYHLCREGWTDLLLLEKAELTSGSTWHAAGQVSHSVSHLGLAHINKYATELYPRLEAETGQNCSWHGSGSLRLAYTRDELDWLQYTVSVGRNLGLNLEVIGPGEIADLHPFYNLDGVVAALYTPDDGHVDPAGVAFAMARGARQMGAEVVRFNQATGVSRKAGGEWRVHTRKGDIDCEILVNAGGTYARQIGQWLGLELPIANLLHHYLITEPVPEFKDLERELPVIRDDRQVSGYIRMEQQSALIGIYEKANAATVWDQGTPWEAEHELFDPDYERIAPWLENALERLPVVAELGIRRVVHGAITHPPDGNMLLGPVRGLGNFWLCCGSQIGIAWGPGAGKYLAQWMVHGAADISMRPFDPRRFGPWIDDQYRLDKAKEDYLLRHETPFPHLDRPACRPAKTSPLYEVLKDKGAVYEEVFGWEYGVLSNKEKTILLPEL